MRLKQYFLVAVSLYLTLTSSLISAAVYYVDANGSDSNDGLSQTTPWKSISKVNSMMPSVTPGSQILFKRGDTFYGGIASSKSGTAGNEIVFGSYGTGDLPVITGLKSITGWTIYSGNIYVANFTDTLSYIYANSKLMTIARFPNSRFLKVDNGSSTTNFYDAELTQSAGYWNQANCRVRSANWCFETRTVSNFSGGYVTFSSATQNTVYSKSGYYFDNKMSLLDTANEWYYDKPAGKIYFYAPGGVDPNTMNVEAAVIKYGFNQNYSSAYVTIQDLNFTGFRENCLEIYIADNIKIQRCIIRKSGKYGIRLNGNYEVIDNCVFEDNINTAITGVFTNCEIKFNTVKRTGLYPGYGIDAWGCHGVQMYTSNGTTFRNNIIDSTGYTGMIASRNMLVKNNYINNSCLAMNDGGGIDIDDADGLQILDNIITNTYGNIDASVSPIRYANGIYFGPNVTKNILIKGNTLANNNYAGINVDNKPTSSNNQIIQNTFYNNAYSQLIMTDLSASSFSASYGNTIRNNLFYCLNYVETCMEHQMFHSSAFSDFGDFDSNYYCNPYTEYIFRKSIIYGAYSTKLYRMSRWKALFNEDLTSGTSSFVFDQYRILDTISTNLILNPRFTSNLLNWSTTPTAGSSIFYTTNPLLDTGCMKITWNGNGGPEGLTSSNYLTMSKNNYFTLSFDFAGNHTGDFSVFGRPNAGSNPPLFAKRYLGYENYRRHYSVIFKPDTTDPQSRVCFSMVSPDSVMFVDNVYLHQINAERIDSTLKNRLFINPTSSLQSFSLGGIPYKNPDGSIVTGSITLQPFTSRILVNDASVIQKHLLLNLLIEGMYDPVNLKMNPDTVKIILRNTSSPYAVIDSAKSVVDSSGKGEYLFSKALNGINYFMTIIHRNSIETWSSAGVGFSGNEAVYNFTTSSSQAFGNNLKLSGTKYCIYSGDVNTDGAIDGADLTLIENDIMSNETGYKKTDINGDYIIDGSDLLTADNNAFGLITKITP